MELKKLDQLITLLEEFDNEYQDTYLTSKEDNAITTVSSMVIDYINKKKQNEVER